jgi:hypothetical protein
MNERERTEARTRTRANAKITVHSAQATPCDRTAGPALMEIRLSETFAGDLNRRIPGSGLAGPARRSIGQHGQHAAIPWQAGRTPGHLRAARLGDRRERHDQGDVVRRSRIRNRRACGAARRGRLRRRVWKRVRRNARLLVRMMPLPSVSRAVATATPRLSRYPTTPPGGSAVRLQALCQISSAPQIEKSE